MSFINCLEFIKMNKILMCQFMIVVLIVVLFNPILSIDNVKMLFT